MRIAVYTAIYGDYDDLRDQKRQNVDVDWICFTDNPDLKSDFWDVRYEPFVGDYHPRLAAKKSKTTPGVWLPNHDASLWIDASITIVRDDLVEMAQAQEKDGWTLHTHPERDNIVAEVDASYFWCAPKYHDQPLDKQVQYYFGQGYPNRFGLWATGVIWRNHEITAAPCQAWWRENANWSYQDQLSLPFIFWYRGIEPGEFPWNQVDNPYFHIGHHRRAD